MMEKALDLKGSNPKSNISLLPHFGKALSLPGELYFLSHKVKIIIQLL